MKLVALTSFAAGYVLGAKAGRERYEQIRPVAMRIANNPRVQETAHSAADKAREQAPVVGHKLADALYDGRIRAAVDVTDPEPLPAGHRLWQAPNLLLSPHVGGASSAMWPRAYRLVRAQLERFARGEPLENLVTGEY